MPRAAQRSPSADPRPGDVLLWKTYSIAVTERQGDDIFYSVTDSHSAHREARQGIAEWREWTKLAKVRQRAGECVILKSCASGPCSVCREWLDREVHSTDAGGFFCAEHCPAEKHR